MIILRDLVWLLCWTWSSACDVGGDKNWFGDARRFFWSIELIQNSFQHETFKLRISEFVLHALGDVHLFDIAEGSFAYCVDIWLAVFFWVAAVNFFHWHVELLEQSRWREMLEHAALSLPVYRIRNDEVDRDAQSGDDHKRAFWRWNN